MATYDRAGESPVERIDRNWEELLQELRVSQTGVQILTGFLLTMPFQPSFRTLSDFERGAYLWAISTSIIATSLLIAPVAMHRALFRRRRKDSLVHAGHRISQLGLGFLAAAIIGVVTLVFSLVFNGAAGLAAGLVASAMFLGLWVVLPLLIRGEMADPETP